MYKTSIEQFLARFEKKNTRIGYQVSFNDFFVGFPKITHEEFWF